MKGFLKSLDSIVSSHILTRQASSALTPASFTLGCESDSRVAMKRVPMSTPSAWSGNSFSATLLTWDGQRSQSAEFPPGVQDYYAYQRRTFTLRLIPW